MLFFVEGINIFFVCCCGGNRDDDADVVSDRDYEYVADFMEMIGGKVDKTQTWVTGTAISATVKTSGEAVVSFE